MKSTGNSSIDKLKILHVSDIHLGNPLVDTKVLKKNLEQWLYPKLKDIDVLIISGDVFHTLINLSSEVAMLAIEIILDILTLTNREGVYIRVLRGTYHHDRDQCNMFLKLHRENMFKSNLKYYDKIDIEVIKELNINLLYLPDDLPYKNSDEVMVEVNRYMKQAKVKNIDIVVLHGVLEHILAPMGIIKPPRVVFTENQLDQVCTGLVLAGHIHTPSQYKNKYYYAGSFDRSRHNEEEDKGYWYFDHGTPQFIVNETSIPFISLDFTSINDPVLGLNKLKTKLEHYKDTPLAYIRLVVNTRDIGKVLMESVFKEYPNIKFSLKIINRINNDSISSIEIEQIDLVDITPSNLPMIMHDFINRELNRNILLESITDILSTLDK